MAMNQVKSGLMSRLGKKLDEAVRKHADDPTEYGVIQVPPGINNGVAQLTECKFDIFKTGANQGEYYFRAAGTILEPESVMVNGTEVPVAGLQTSILVPVCDTKTQDGKQTPVEQHIETVLNEMRKLGAATEGCGGGDLEALAESLKEAAPYFRFSTSLGKATPQFPNPRIWENWHGARGLDNYTPPDTSGQVQDDTGAAPAKAPTNGHAKAAAPAPSKPAPTAKPATKTAPKAPPAPEPIPEDIDILINSAGDDDSPMQADCQAKLTEMAMEAGATEEEITLADNWTQVAALIETNASKAADGDEGDGSWEPKKDDVYFYTPVDQKTKKPAKGAKAVECQVIAVDVDRKRVTLKNLDNPKTAYMNVPFDQLKEEAS
jgi:hypothetical protein